MGYIRPPYTRIIEPELAGDGLARSQHEWIDLCNSERKAMISAPDFYRAPDVLLPGLRSDLYRGNFMTSTTPMIYGPHEMMMRVVHDLTSRVVEPSGKKNVPFPQDGKFKLLDLMAADNLGIRLDYVRTIFDTKDNPEAIFDRLIHISGAKDVVLWMARNNIKKNGGSPVMFGFGDNALHIDNGYFADFGYTRAVTIVPGEQRT